jgi:hypothetical protein
VTVLLTGLAGRLSSGAFLGNYRSSLPGINSAAAASAVHLRERAPFNLEKFFGLNPSLYQG